MTTVAGTPGRILFVVPPFAGHVNPTASLAAELTDRGHDVAWCGPRDIRPLLPAGARLLTTGDAPDGGYPVLRARWENLRGVSALRFLVEEVLTPLTRQMLPVVNDAVTVYRPDVVVADQQAFAGAIAAQRRGVRWAVSASTSVEFADPFRGYPKIENWVRARVTMLTAQAGCRPFDPRFSPHLNIVFSTPELSGVLPGPRDRYVGPALTGRPRPVTEFPWDALAPARKRVLVTLGTLNREAGTRFLPSVVEAARPLADRVQLILAATAAQLGTAASEAPYVLRRDWVPQLELLPHVDAVVTHGGHNTVCEALAFGLPLMVAPIRDDQPEVARQVVAAGAGVRVRFGRADVPELRRALTRVLDEPALRDGALRLRRSFASAGGSRAAADALEGLMCARQATRSEAPA